MNKLSWLLMSITLVCLTACQFSPPATVLEHWQENPVQSQCRIGVIYDEIKPKNDYKSLFLSLQTPCKFDQSDLVFFDPETTLPQIKAHASHQKTPLLLIDTRRWFFSEGKSASLKSTVTFTKDDQGIQANSINDNKEAPTALTHLILINSQGNIQGEWQLVPEGQRTPKHYFRSIVAYFNQKSSD